MPKSIFILLQYLTPHYLFTQLMGRLAESQRFWLKNFLIKRFIKHYKINLGEAIIETPDVYSSFNQFFIRQLKPNARPICQEEHEIASPVDGIITQLGTIFNNQLLQAKNYYYNLENLLGGNQLLADNFHNGLYATFYLAPHHYHRVHMPLNGTLEQTIYVPGKLFSVNPIMSESIPQLFTRNERLITIFNTHVGKMAVILIGAMIVGNIQTVWLNHPFRGNKIVTLSSNPITLSKGAELGYFKIGSTVILLYEQNKIRWEPSLIAKTNVQLGQCVGILNNT
ncbi:MAG: phosphatidylserine decarboxylase [Gammaproteobacteria bacterium RIFCSPHIGHO2_12_FULL_37_34]|nr:MAG: phosphatidylserine decarboxylase [Gammaproteobacteria bacterium RIFCSPHIGHO2_12_FULL_37_34]